VTNRVTTRMMLLIALWMTWPVSATFGQVAISTTPGLLLYSEGQVFLDEDQVEFEPAQLATLKLGQRFRVADGRAELLLSPRALIWMGKQSELEFLSEDLLNVRVRLTEGSAFIQVMGHSGREQASPLSVVCGQTEIQLPGKGLYRFDCDPALARARLTVHRGIATIQSGQQTYEVRKKQSVILGNVGNLGRTGSEPRREPFLAAASDPFGEWSWRRSADLAKSSRRFAKRMRWTD